MSLLLVGLLACRSGTDPAPPAAGDTSTPTEPPGDALVQFEGDPPKNVLMISIDTFRRDHVGRFGNLGLKLPPEITECSVRRMDRSHVGKNYPALAINVHDDRFTLWTTKSNYQTIAHPKHVVV